MREGCILLCARGAYDSIYSRGVGGYVRAGRFGKNRTTPYFIQVLRFFFSVRVKIRHGTTYVRRLLRL